MAKKKTCKYCLKPFTPTYSSLQVCCSIPCSRAFNSTKEVKKRVNQMKKDLKTHKDYLNVLQVVFNKWIRIRDKGLPCISCGCKVDNGHASHFFSVGAHPSLRFDEDNVHVSCIRCNTELHGNTTNYAYRLPKKIGWERFEELHFKSQQSNKLTIPEILDKINYYKTKIKQHENKENTN